MSDDVDAVLPRTRALCQDLEYCSILTWRGGTKKQYVIRRVLERLTVVQQTQCRAKWSDAAPDCVEKRAVRKVGPIYTVNVITSIAKEL